MGLMPDLRWVPWCLLFLCPWLAATAGELQFQRLLMTDDGGDTSSNLSAVRGTIEDQRGFIWFAGENGLARYHGHELVVYRTDPDDPRSISGNFVWAMALDHDGVLWVGTGRGLNRYNPKTDDFDRFTSATGASGTLSNDNINALAVDRHNNLLVGTANGLNVLNADRSAFSTYYFSEARSGLQGENLVREILIDSKGRIWVGGSRAGLNLFDLERGTFFRYVHDPEDPTSIIDNDVSAIAEDHLGRLWVGTYNRGLSRMSSDGSRFESYRHDPADPTSLASNNVADILVDKSHGVWVALDHGGLSLYVEETDTFRNFRHNAYDSNSLSSNHPRHLYEDSQGNLWVGMFPTGVNFLDHSASVFTNYIHKPDVANSLSDSGVLFFFEDSSGMLWIGTENGLNSFDRSAGVFRRYYPNPQDPHALQHGAVLTIEEDASGDLWVGTWSGGLHRFDRSTEKFRHYVPDPTDPNSISGDLIWRVLRDSDDTIWVATETNGLNRYVPETDSFVRYLASEDDPSSLISNQLWTMLEDSYGDLWVGTLEGLTRYDRRAGEFRHYLHDPADATTISSDHIISLFQDSRGILWVGTRDAGLNMYQYHEGRFSALRVSDGLPSDTISSIIEDRNGAIWVTTVSGIARIDVDTFEISTYRRSHGLSSNNFNRDATFRDADGMLYVGGINGFSVFDPDRLVHDSSPPPVVITGLRVMNKPVAIGADDGILPIAISELDRIRLGHRHTMFSFDFAALSYRSPTSNRYAYMLEGFDRDWNEIGNQTSATYTNINPGRYVFRVIAANRDGVWNEEGTAIVVEIEPPPWRSLWAYIVYALVLAAAIVLGVRIQALRIRSDIYRKLAATDPLTGIGNRTSIERARQELFAGQSFQQGIGLLIMDVDHFKRINDELGHDAGDQILKEFSDLISGSVRSADKFARWGGEEFLLLCPSIQHGDLLILAEKLRALIEGHVFEVHGVAQRMTVSVGVASATHNEEFDAIFKRADLALYRAKQGGRNRVEVAPPAEPAAE